MINTRQLLSAFSAPFLVAALLLAWNPVARTADSDDESQGQAESREQTIERLSNTIRARFGVDRIESIEPSQVPGMYELFIGGRLIYLSEDGRYLFQGGVLDMLTKVNLSERSMQAHQARMEPLRKEVLGAYPEEKLVVFSPEEPLYDITVVTDTTCGYCRKFHREISQLLEAGVKVRYLLFPRSGLSPGSGGYSAMVSVWCAEDKADALTRVKAGERIEQAECENPVAEHYRMAQEFGVSGTPTIFTGSGRMIAGYMPAQELIQTLKAEPGASQHTSDAADE